MCMENGDEAKAKEDWKHMKKEMDSQGAGDHNGTIEWEGARAELSTA